jgi:hypothetical protein
MAAFLMIVMIALACGGETGDSPAKDDSSRAEKAAPEAPQTEPAVESTEDDAEDVQEEDVDEETPEPTPAAPERVRFKRGESQGRINLNLAPNETRKYVLGVSPAQDFHVGIDDERPMIRIPNTSRLTEIETGGYYYSAVTISTGDIVFEISNPTRGTVRTYALVTITDREPMDH